VALVSESAASASIHYQRKLLWESQNSRKNDSAEFSNHGMDNRTNNIIDKQHPAKRNGAV
jgi:hypothetical protein